MRRCLQREGSGGERLAHRLALSLLLLGPAFCAGAQWHTQSLELGAGWNAVFIEVTPAPGGCAEVFKGLSVMSVWTWNPKVPGPRFLRNPEDLLPEEPEWLTWFPEGSPQSFMSNLHRIVGGRAYLIHLSGAPEGGFSISGKLAAPDIVWSPDAFNLVGAYVDSEAPPTFGAYYGVSKAHAAQPVYRLDASGKWGLVEAPEKTALRAGEAYWIRCEGESDFVGPFSLSFATQSKGVYFPEGVTEATLSMVNESAEARAVVVRLLASENPPAGSEAACSAGAVPLSYVDLFANDEKIAWRDFEGPISLNLPGSGKMDLRLAVRRHDMALLKSASEEALYQGVLEIEDGAGVLYRAPVSAVRGGTVESDVLTKAYPQELGSGLWVGTVALNEVSKAGDSTVMLETHAGFSLRILVHVDASGAATLLDEVIEMADYTGDDGDLEGPASRRVLLTREELVSTYSGVTARDGEPFGRRISSSTLSFPQDVDEVAMTRSGDRLQTDIYIPYDDPKNPFVHRYHPDHNNRSEDFSSTESDGDESYSFVRRITLQFTVSNPETGEAVTDPAWTDTEVGGTYTETFYGYKDGAVDESTGGFIKHPLTSKGYFYLTKVSEVDVLNDGQ